MRCTTGHEFEWSSAHGYSALQVPTRNQQVAEAAHHAENLTKMLRSSSADVHVALRTALAGAHLPLEEVRLAQLLPEGGDCYWGLLVTSEGRVLVFTLAHAGFAYQERTSDWQALAHRTAVEAVLMTLGQG